MPKSTSKIPSALPPLAERKTKKVCALGWYHRGRRPTYLMEPANHEPLLLDQLRLVLRLAPDVICIGARVRASKAAKHRLATDLISQGYAVAVQAA